VTHAVTQVGGSAATAMSHALKELFGQFDWVQRSLLILYVGLEQGGRSALYIAHPRHAGQGINPAYSLRKAILLIFTSPEPG
jgi:hypothetical protein